MIQVMRMVKTINLRDLPEQLVREAKIRAATEGITLRAFVIGAIKLALNGKAKK